jgi:hypothetical protein
MTSSITVIQSIILDRTLVKADSKSISYSCLYRSKTVRKAVHEPAEPLDPDRPGLIAATPTFGPVEITDIQAHCVHRTTPCNAIEIYKPTQKPPTLFPELMKRPRRSQRCIPFLSLHNIENSSANDLEAQIPCPMSLSFKRSHVSTPCTGTRFFTLIETLSQKARIGGFVSGDIKTTLAQKSCAYRPSFINRLERASNTPVLLLNCTPNNQIGDRLGGWLRYKAVSTLTSRMGLEDDGRESFKFKLDKQDEYLLMEDDDDEDNGDDNDEGVQNTPCNDIQVFDFSRMSYGEFCSAFFDDDEYIDGSNFVEIGLVFSLFSGFFILDFTTQSFSLACFLLCFSSPHLF